MANYGMKISLPGYDVMTAEPENCVIHSGYASPKFITEAIGSQFYYGTATCTFASDPPDSVETAIFTINHSLGYAPMALARGVYTQGANVFTGALPIEPTATLYFATEATSTTFKIIVYRNAGWGSIIGATFKFSYIVFVENGA